MHSKRSISYLIIMFASAIFGCRESVKEENKNEDSVNAVSPAHTGGEKFPIDTRESVITWKGSMVIGSNAHTGYVYLSKGELMVQNGLLTGGMAEVDMNTIEDDNHRADNNLINHLKDPDFFDVKKFPNATMSITAVEQTNAAEKKVSGNLTIKGITNPVSFPVNVELYNGFIKANGKLVIDRTKWDVRYKSGKFYDLLADQTMSDSIEFRIKIVARK